MGAVTDTDVDTDMVVDMVADTRTRTRTRTRIRMIRIIVHQPRRIIVPSWG